jgi:shikimate dehydrogenase
VVQDKRTSLREVGDNMAFGSTPPGACVIGQPISHSRSPLIHRYWLREHGIAGSYDKREVSAAELPDFVRNLSRSGLVGCNVTLPHKEAVVALADTVSEVVTTLGAANTLWLENGKLRADNSDVHGFLANLDQTQPTWQNITGRALVLGAGGAARGIVYGLIRRGVPEVFVANRTLDKASALAGQLGAQVMPAAWPPAPELLASVDLLVNTTSLGMAGQPALELDLTALKRTAIVCDAVYVPLKTPLLYAAEHAGLRTVDGLGMLLHQAVFGFERWFGVRPQVSADLRRTIEADLGNSGRSEALAV